MKFKAVLAVLLFFIMLLPVYAKEDAYIVKLNNDIRLFDEENVDTAHRNFFSVSREELEDLLDMGIVEYYEPDHTVILFEDYTSSGVSSDISFEQWNLSAINVKKAWDIGCYGNNVKVAVIDSGVYKHPDLIGCLMDGYNYIENSTNTTDRIGHGTYVSGIIAAESNNKYITGIAHRVQIVPLKCFDVNAVTTSSMLANAIYDAVDIYDCDIINMSFGMLQQNKTLQLSIEYAIQNGCIVVAAVGNDGGNSEYYPAKFNNVIGVGSTDKNNKLSWFSQHNTTVDTVAPGESLESVSIDGYTKNSGTSFSCPHVSAVAAIAKCIDKKTDAQKFMRLIEKTSSKCETDTIDGYDIYYGYGIVNTENLVNEMLNGSTVFLSPSTNGIVKVYNASDKPIVAEIIVTSHTEQKMSDIRLHDIHLTPGEVRDIPLIFGGAVTKVMVWDKIKPLMPLCPAREYRFKQNGYKVFPSL